MGTFLRKCRPVEMVKPEHFFFFLGRCGGEWQVVGRYDRSKSRSRQWLGKLSQACSFAFFWASLHLADKNVPFLSREALMTASGEAGRGGSESPSCSRHSHRPLQLKRLGMARYVSGGRTSWTPSECMKELKKAQVWWGGMEWGRGNK